MGSKKTIIVAGSILAGILAVLLVFNYVRGIENQQSENARLVEVFTTKADISKGALGEQVVAGGGIAVSQINAEFLPQGAIIGTDEIAAKVAVFDIPPNTVITRGMFVDPAEASLSFQARLSNPDYVAVSIQLDQVRSAGGFISPGDYVNMMISSTTPEGTPSLSMLYQKVKVLAVGDRINPGPQEGGPIGGSGLLTFEVPQEAALVITAAAQTGSLYLTLVPNNYVPVPYPTIALPNISVLPGQDPAQLTPYGPEGLQ